MLHGKVAIITGAGSGIGRESALLFAQQGATVVVADIVEDTAQEVADLIGENAFFIQVDVSSWDDMERLIGETVGRFGHLDVLFNNAGIEILQATTVVGTTEADWDRMMAVNLKGVFLGVRHALPVMMSQLCGVIINTASRAGIGAGSRMAAYCASKGGVVSLTSQLAVDYAPYNIRVNCICPGGMEKPMADHHVQLQKTPGALKERRERLTPKIPLGRLCRAKDIAHAALYLASEESAHVTGTALVVDGGNLAL
jgi:NAD(P)-dependent dehydrogenase (short-subunit alcohol dehydrogenase family)